MIDWDVLKETDLGGELTTDDIRDLKLKSKAIYGGVSWPDKRPGLAVVLAMDSRKRLGNHDVYLLDEFEFALEVFFIG